MPWGALTCYSGVKAGTADVERCRMQDSGLSPAQHYSTCADSPVNFVTQAREEQQKRVTCYLRYKCGCGKKRKNGNAATASLVSTEIKDCRLK